MSFKGELKHENADFVLEELLLMGYDRYEVITELTTPRNNLPLTCTGKLSLTSRHQLRLEGRLTRKDTDCGLFPPNWALQLFHLRTHFDVMHLRWLK